MKRIAMVSYSFYESDNRVMRYAEALRERGDFVDVFSLAASDDAPRFEVLNGINVHRLQTRVRDEKGKSAYFLRILRFLCVSFFSLSRRQLKKGYDVVHVHNIPDFLVFSALLPKLGGARIILDIHDILPEFFASKFDGGENSFYFHLLRWIERISCAFADHVIISNHLWLATITGRSVSPKKCSALINYVDQTVFYRRPRTRSDNRRILIFPGGLHWHQGLDIAIKAFKRIQPQFPQAEFHIYGGGPMKEKLVEMVRDLNLRDCVRFFDPLPLRQVADVIANADVGVVPKRADSFGNEAYSTKILEFMSQGIPVLASSTKVDRFYFSDSVLRFFPSGDDEALAVALSEVLSTPDVARALVRNADKFLEENNWSVKKREYFALVDNVEYSAPAPGRSVEKEPEGALAVR
jgi:glycosyltransferase involved in cell wall biosynthesis